MAAILADVNKNIIAILVLNVAYIGVAVCVQRVNIVYTEAIITNAVSPLADKFCSEAEIKAGGFSRVERKDSGSSSN